MLTGPNNRSGGFFPIQFVVEYKLKSAPHPTCRKASGGVIFAREVALVLSQDEDLSEVADEVRALVREQGRWVKIASAFPDSPTRRYRRGVNKTDWIRIDRATYDACLDAADYRPRKPKL